MRNRSGFILITVLWVLAILALLALSLNKGSALELSLIRNSVGKTKSYAAARAGISYVQSLLAKEITERDTLYQCGIKRLERQTSEMIFKGIKVDNDTHFDILFLGSSYGTANNKSLLYGLEDEQGKINLNAIDGTNYKILSALLQQFELNEKDADRIAAAVIDWHSDTTEVFSSPQGNIKGAKDDFYMSQSLPYKCKKRPFDRIEELLLVRGVTKELFERIKPHVTVFPKYPPNGFKINFNTASNAVIMAVVQGASTGLAQEDVKAGLIRYRNGMDQIPGTADDAVNDQSMFSATQELYMNALRNNQGIDQSEYFRVHALGVDEASGVRSSITAVIYRPLSQEGLAIVEWNRE